MKAIMDEINDKTTSIYYKLLVYSIILYTAYCYDEFFDKLGEGTEYNIGTIPLFISSPALLDKYNVKV